MREVIEAYAHAHAVRCHADHRRYPPLAEALLLQFVAGE